MSWCRPVPGVARPDVLDMTSADGRTHAITDAAFAEGVHQGVGRYRALCGVTILAAAMASDFGPDCRACRDHTRGAA